MPWPWRAALIALLGLLCAASARGDSPSDGAALSPASIATDAQSRATPPASGPADSATDSAKALGGVASGFKVPDLTKRENVSSAMQLVVLLTVLSLAPAILIMMTSFTRIVIVLSLLRQALGTQQLPPNQVLVGLAMFMTFLIMGPTWSRVNGNALQPYMDGHITQNQALHLAQQPVRNFMIAQINRAGNAGDVLLFCDFAGEHPRDWKDVGTMTIVPGFMLSELKTAFLMGFKIYLPFLVIDMVISSVLTSMGMMMLPPALISLPFKLLLFVLVDGWHLITASLLGSFVLK
jgi:flagellar biosynthetic protein FliP